MTTQPTSIREQIVRQGERIRQADTWADGSSGGDCAECFSTANRRPQKRDLRLRCSEYHSAVAACAVAVKAEGGRKGGEGCGGVVGADRSEKTKRGRSRRRKDLVRSKKDYPIGANEEKTSCCDK